MIEDVNDNKPTFPNKEMLICEKEGERGSAVVVAEDEDSGHFSSPFSFSLPPDNDGKWALETINGRLLYFSHFLLQMETFLFYFSAEKKILFLSVQTAVKFTKMPCCELEMKARR